MNMTTFILLLLLLLLIIIIIIIIIISVAIQVGNSTSVMGSLINKNNDCNSEDFI